MLAEHISVMKPQPPREEFLNPRLHSVAFSGIFANRGPQVRELESRLAAWLDVNESHLVVTSNATVALTAAVSLSPAMKWHVPAWSFPATALAPLHIGKPTTFVDIHRDTWLVIDRERNNATGLINVIPFGGSFDETAWSQPGEIVIDAAASLASRPAGLKDLPENAVVIFSLHATKTMGGAEGGVVVFGSEERAKLARSWINFGFSGTRESVVLGTNGKMSEYDAAVANARLDGWSEEEVGWEMLRKQTITASRALGLEKAPESMSSINPYWIALFESKEQKETALGALESEGVETRLWWAKGLHNMPAFKSVPRQSLEVVNDISERYLGLPFHLDLSRKELDCIVGTLENAR